MSKSVRIVTDSSSDLPRTLVDEFEIEVVPLTVHLGDDTYEDGELSPDDLWAKLGDARHPKTSQPAVGRFEQIFEQLVSQGKQVLCVTITSKHSGTFNAARLAAQRFGAAVHVFDSFSASLGQGLQALSAARAARAGASIQEILVSLQELRSRTNLVAVLDTLKNLQRGGRADAFIAAAERMVRALDIKLIINVIDGQLRPCGAARTLKNGVRHVLNLVEQMGPMEQLAVIHTRSQDKAAEIAERLTELARLPKERIFVQEIGAVLACHAGPGMVGVVTVRSSGNP